MGQDRADGGARQQGSAADQCARRQGHHLTGVPEFREGQAVPGADGRLVRVAAQRRDPSAKKAPKTPFYMYGGDGELLFMAGLWSTWRPKDAPKDAPPLLSCTIITTDAAGPLAADP